MRVEFLPELRARLLRRLLGWITVRLMRWDCVHGLPAETSLQELEDNQMIDLKDFQQKKSLKAVKIGDAYMVHILTIYKADTLQQVKNACRANNVGIREDLSNENEIYAE